MASSESAVSLVRRRAGAGPRQPAALPSGRHHEPDPQEALGHRQEAAGSLPVLGFGEDPRGWRVRCGATRWRSTVEAPQVSTKLPSHSGSMQFAQRMTADSSLCASQPSPWQRRASVSSAGVAFVSSCTAWGRRPTAAAASAWPTATSPPQTCWS